MGQIQRGEQENPSYVDEMPVRAGYFDGEGFCSREAIAPRERQFPEHQANAREHVRAVETG